MPRTITAAQLDTFLSNPLEAEIYEEVPVAVLAEHLRNVWADYLAEHGLMEPQADLFRATVPRSLFARADSRVTFEATAEFGEPRVDIIFNDPALAPAFHDFASFAYEPHRVEVEGESIIFATFRPEQWRRGWENQAELFDNFLDFREISEARAANRHIACQPYVSREEWEATGGAVTGRNPQVGDEVILHGTGFYTGEQWFVPAENLTPNPLDFFTPEGLLAYPLDDEARTFTIVR